MPSDLSPVRLACLIHAASVRSEPESNSPSNIIFEIAGPNGISRFHLRHASQALHSGLSPSCLFAYTSTARVTTFFPSLASTNPTLSELGRSFKPVLLRAILIAQRTALRRVR